MYRGGRAGDSTARDRIYCGVIYLWEDWVGAEQTTSKSVRVIRYQTHHRTVSVAQLRD